MLKGKQTATLRLAQLRLPIIVTDTASNRSGADGTTRGRGRGRGRGSRGGATGGTTRGGAAVAATTATAAGGSTSTTLTKNGQPRKQRVTKAAKAQMEQEKVQRESMAPLAAKPTSYPG